MLISYLKMLNLDVIPLDFIPETLLIFIPRTLFAPLIQKVWPKYSNAENVNCD